MNRGRCFLARMCGTRKWKPFVIFSICFLATVSCQYGQETAPGAAGPVQAPEHIADWTAGIVSGRNRVSPGAFSLVQAVRAAKHEDFDRIVFEFGTPGVPDFHIEYVDEPVRECGSGNALRLPGDGWLMIRFSAAGMHHEGKSTVENRDFRTNLPVVLRLVATCDFENQVTWIAAVSTPNKYRVLALDNPPRLVVDIRHR